MGFALDLVREGLRRASSSVADGATEALDFERDDFRRTSSSTSASDSVAGFLDLDREGLRLSIISSSTSALSMTSDLATDFERDRAFFFTVGGGSTGVSSSSSPSSTFFNPDRLELRVLLLGVLADDFLDVVVALGFRGVFAVDCPGFEGSESSSPSPSNVLVGKKIESWCFVRDVDRDGGLDCDLDEGFIDCAFEGGFVLVPNSEDAAKNGHV